MMYALENHLMSLSSNTSFVKKLENKKLKFRSSSRKTDTFDEKLTVNGQKFIPIVDFDMNASIRSTTGEPIQLSEEIRRFIENNQFDPPLQINHSKVFQQNIRYVLPVGENYEFQLKPALRNHHFVIDDESEGLKLAQKPYFTLMFSKESKSGTVKTLKIWELPTHEKVVTHLISGKNNHFSVTSDPDFPVIFHFIKFIFVDDMKNINKIVDLM